MMTSRVIDGPPNTEQSLRRDLEKIGVEKARWPCHRQSYIERLFISPIVGESRRSLSSRLRNERSGTMVRSNYGTHSAERRAGADAGGVRYQPE